MAQHVHNKAMLTRALALARQRPRYLLLALLVLLGFLIALFCGTAAARGDRDALIERSSDEAVSLPDMDTEMRRLANGTIAKLERMTDADFDGQRFDFTGE